MADLSFLTDQGRFNYRVAAVIQQGESVLVMTDAGLPYYYLPGGRVRLHETSEAALRRELREELKTEITSAKLLWFNENFFVEAVSQEHFHEICLYYLVELPGDSPLFEQSEFQCNENGTRHIFTWVLKSELESAQVLPAFLAQELALQQESIKHLVHTDQPLDQALQSSQVFDRLAERYQAKFMDLTLYDQSYLAFCEALTPGQAKVLDCACGPGNVSRYLMSQRPELKLLGIDLAPRMVELAQAAVPSAEFVVHDVRQLLALERRFDGIICAFGLPYLSDEELVAFIAAAEQVLEPGGVLYLSLMLGNRADSGLQHSPTGEAFYVYYHSQERIQHLLEDRGFSLLMQEQMSSPASAAQPTRDLIVIAKKYLSNS